jgi:hypothetical protein
MLPNEPSFRMYEGNPFRLLEIDWVELSQLLVQIGTMCGTHRR